MLIESHCVIMNMTNLERKSVYNCNNLKLLIKNTTLFGFVGVFACVLTLLACNEMGSLNGGLANAKSNGISGDYFFHDEKAFRVDSENPDGEPMTVIMNAYSFTSKPYEVTFEYNVEGGSVDDFVDHFYCVSTCQSFDTKTLGTTCATPSCVMLSTDEQKEEYASKYRHFQYTHDYQTPGSYDYSYTIVGTIDMTQTVHLE